MARTAQPAPARWRRAGAAALAAALVAACSGGGADGGGVADTAAAPTIRVDGAQVVVALPSGVITIDTTDLGVQGRGALSGPAATPLGEPTPATVDALGAHWSYPARGLEVQVDEVDGHAVFVFTAESDQTLAWPVTGAGMDDLQIPLGDGLQIPVADPFWNGPDPQLVNGDGFALPDLTLPLWGVSRGSTGAGYLVPLTDIGTTLRLGSGAGRLQATASHTFALGKGRNVYSVMITQTDGSPLAVADDYRKLLAHNNAVTTLQQKIDRNPEVARLIGAVHSYNWGAARSAAAVERLRALGVQRLWLGYDTGGWPADSVRAATAAGYLVAPYDNYSDAQDPATADRATAVWPAGLWPQGCVIDAAGQQVAGAGGRGCALSSAALAARGDVLERRLAARTGDGVNGYFLDADANGQTFDDYSTDHPMNQQDDRRNRLARMSNIAGRLVLGSSTVAPWAAAVVAVSHGSSTPALPALFAAERDRGYWGADTGPDGADRYLKPVVLSPALHTVLFDPRYRIPLYEAVLHDSVISLERPELPFNKFPAEQRNRALLSLLYVTPLNFALNAGNLEQLGPQLAALQRDFATVADIAATEPLTGFAWLTGDHLVQRTVFGDAALRVTANFSGADFHDAESGTVRAGCALARAGARQWTLCPADHLPAQPAPTR